MGATRQNLQAQTKIIKKLLEHQIFQIPQRNRTRALYLDSKYRRQKATHHGEPRKMEDMQG
jgi:DNA-dependent RNA polymerase auxiliary subunit epsilon